MSATIASPEGLRFDPLPSRYELRWNAGHQVLASVFWSSAAGLSISAACVVKYSTCRNLEVAFKILARIKSVTLPSSSQSPVVLQLARESRAEGLLSEYWELAAETSNPASLADLRRLGALNAAETAVKILQAVKEESSSLSAAGHAGQSQRRSYIAAMLFCLALLDTVVGFGNGSVNEDTLVHLRLIQSQCYTAARKAEASLQEADAESLHRLDLQLLTPMMEVIKQTAKSSGPRRQQQARDLVEMCSTLLRASPLKRIQLDAAWIFNKGAAHICYLAKRWYQEEGELEEAAELLRQLMALQNHAEGSVGISRAAFFVRLGMWDILQESFLSKDPTKKRTVEKQRACMRDCLASGSAISEILNGTDNVAVVPLASHLWVQLEWHLSTHGDCLRYPDDEGVDHLFQTIQLLTKVMRIRGFAPQDGNITMHPSEMFAILDYADSLGNTLQEAGCFKTYISRLMLALLNVLDSVPELGNQLLRIEPLLLLRGLAIACRSRGQKTTSSFSEALRLTAGTATAGVYSGYFLEVKKSGLEIWRGLVSVVGSRNLIQPHAVEVLNLLGAISVAIMKEPMEYFRPDHRVHFGAMIKEARPAMTYTLMPILKELESSAARKDNTTVIMAANAMIAVHSMHAAYCPIAAVDLSAAEMCDLQHTVSQALALATGVRKEGLAWAQLCYAAALLANTVHARRSENSMPIACIKNSPECALIWKYSLRQTEWAARQLPSLDFESLRNSTPNSKFPRISTDLPPEHASYAIRTGILAASTTCLLIWQTGLEDPRLAAAQEDTARFVSSMLQCIGICLGTCDAALQSPPQDGYPFSNAACMHYARHIPEALVRLATIGPPQGRAAAFERLVELFDLADKLLWESRTVLLDSEMTEDEFMPYMMVCAAFESAFERLPELQSRCRRLARVWRYILDVVMPVATEKFSVLQILHENVIFGILKSLMGNILAAEKRLVQERADLTAELVEKEWNGVVAEAMCLEAEEKRADAAMACLLAEEEEDAMRKAAKNAKKRSTKAARKRGKAPSASLKPQILAEPSATGRHSSAEGPQNMAESRSSLNAAAEASSSQLQDAQPLKGGVPPAAADETVSDKDGWQPSPAVQKTSKPARKGVSAAKEPLPCPQPQPPQPPTTPQRMNEGAVASSSGTAKELGSSMQSLSLSAGEGVGPVADSASTDPPGCQAFGQPARGEGLHTTASRTAETSSRVKPQNSDKGKQSQLGAAPSTPKSQTAPGEPSGEPLSSSKFREGAGKEPQGTGSSSWPCDRMAAELELEEILGMRTPSATSRPAAPFSPSPARALHRPAPSSGRLPPPAALQQLQTSAGGMGPDSSAANSQLSCPVEMISRGSPPSRGIGFTAAVEPGSYPIQAPPAMSMAEQRTNVGSSTASSASADCGSRQAWPPGFQPQSTAALKAAQPQQEQNGHSRDMKGGLPGLPLLASQLPVLEGGISADQLEDFYSCPITQELMSDPVIAADGFTYERSAVEVWLRKSSSSPMTGAPLRSAELQPNLLVKQMIRALYRR